MTTNSENSTSPGVKPTKTSAASHIIAGSTGSEHKEPPFTLFPKLRLELRRKIWKEACFVPQNIDIWNKPHPNVPSEHLWSLRSYRSHSRIPPVLHATAESRSVALEHYSLRFGTNFYGPQAPSTVDASIPPQIFDNWECDVICPLTLPYDEADIYAFDYITASQKALKRVASQIKNSSLLSSAFVASVDLSEVIIYHVTPDFWKLSLDVSKPFAINFTSLEAITKKQLAEHGGSYAETSLQKGRRVAIETMERFGKSVPLRLALMNMCDKVEDARE